MAASQLYGTLIGVTEGVTKVENTSQPGEGSGVRVSVDDAVLEEVLDIVDVMVGDIEEVMVIVDVIVAVLMDAVIEEDMVIVDVIVDVIDFVMVGVIEGEGMSRTKTSKVPATVP